MYLLSSWWESSNSWPVWRDHASMSGGEPESVEMTFKTWPISSCLMAFEVLITGIGQFKPLQSNVISGLMVVADILSLLLLNHSSSRTIDLTYYLILPVSFSLTSPLRGDHAH